MFNWAWRREYIQENPALRADNPSVALAPPIAPERSVVGAHLEVLWNVDEDLALAVWLAATLGLRRSEVVGLRWSDIDFKEDVIFIRHGIVKVPGACFQMTDTKTGLHGQAEFPLHPYTKEVLEKKKRIYRKQLNAIGSDVTIDGFIFSSDSENSKPLHPDVFTKSLRKHCRRNPELRAITMQSLRKYAASDLAGTGVDETTASALLRNRPETARRHYQAAQTRIVRQHSLGLADRLAEEVA
jgi:integrase